MKTTDSGQSPLLLLDILQILKKEKIEYAIIGALAASFYGILRASLDADAVISMAFPSLRGLEQTFKKAGFHTELRRGDHDDPISAVLAISDKYKNRVDLLAGIRGMDPDAFSRTVETPLLGKSLHMIGIEDFHRDEDLCRLTKERHRRTLKNALAVSGKSVNYALLEKVTRQFGSKPFQNSQDIALI